MKFRLVKNGAPVAPPLPQFFQDDHHQAKILSIGSSHSQIACECVAALINRDVTCVPPYVELASAMKIATSWSVDGVIAGIEDFLILAEFNNDVMSEPIKSVRPTSTGHLQSLTPLALAVEIMMYVQQILEYTFALGHWSTPRDMVVGLHRSQFIKGQSAQNQRHQ